MIWNRAAWRKESTRQSVHKSMPKEFEVTVDVIDEEPNSSRVSHFQSEITVNSFLCLIISELFNVIQKFYDIYKNKLLLCIRLDSS